MSDSPYASPEEAFRTLLQHFWAERMDDASPLLEWEQFARSRPEPARFLLEGLGHVAEDPPDDLAAILSREGHIPLYHADNTPYSREEQVEWLRDFAARVRAAYERARSSADAVLADTLHRFWLMPAGTPPAEAWSEFAREHPADAAALLRRLEAIAADPPEALASIVQTWGNVRLYANGEPAPPEQYVDWLRAELDSLRAVTPGA